MKLLTTFLSCAIVSTSFEKKNIEIFIEEKIQEILLQIFRLVTGLARSGVLKIRLLAIVEVRHF